MKKETFEWRRRNIVSHPSHAPQQHARRHSLELFFVLCGLVRLFSHFGQLGLEVKVLSAEILELFRLRCQLSLRVPSRDSLDEHHKQEMLIIDLPRLPALFRIWH